MEPRDRLEIEIAAESEGWPWRGLLLTAAAATGFYSLYCIYNYRQLSQLSGYIPPKATDATGSAVVIGKRLRIRILNLDGVASTSFLFIIFFHRFEYCNNMHQIFKIINSNFIVISVYL